MLKKKISQLDSANASLSGYIPMSDSAGTVTNKVTVQSILDLVGSAEDSLLRSFFLPPAPTGISVSAGNAQAVVSWTAPTVLTQTPITDYVVQFQPSGGVWQPFSDSVSTTTSAMVTGLQNGVAHQFRVAAVNALGTGNYSTASSAVTPVAGDAQWANVQLLLPGDTSTNDVSSYLRSVTANSAAVSTSQKRWGAGSISISSGQYLAVSSNTSLDMSGDFVIEFWVRLADATAQGWFIGGPDNASGYLMGGFNLTGSGQIWLGRAAVGWPLQFNGASLQNNTWHHIAIARSGTSNRLYVDGTQVGGTITDSTSWVVNPSAVWIGSQAAGTSMNGFIDDFRWTVGSSRNYTGATIPVPASNFPTVGTSGVATDGYFSNVSLLLHADGTGSTFVDSSPTPKTITATNANQSASQSKWGGKSASFGGSGHLSVSGDAGVFGTGDFVVEAWVYLTAAAEQFVADTRSGVSTSGMGFRIFSDNKLYFSGNANNALTTTSVPLNEWAHVAWVRSGGTIRGYINGVLGGTASDSSDLTSTNFVVSRVGFVNAGQINGFIDDLRVTKGSNRGYTGTTIQVPTTAFPDS